MTVRKELALDANGTIFDQKAKVKAIMHVTGKYIPPYRFGPKAQVLEENNLTLDEYREAMCALYETEHFFDWTTLLPEAEIHIRQLHDMGYDLTIVSDCLGLTSERAWRLCERYKLPVKEIITGKDGACKLDYYVQCSVVIDNDPEQLRELLQHKDTKPILMLPAPHGTGYDVIKMPANLRGKIAAGNGWAEVMKHVPLPQAIAA